MNKLSLTSRQLVYVSFATVNGPMLCMVSQVTVATTGRDAWISIAAGGLIIAIIGAFFVSQLAGGRGQTVFADITPVITPIGSKLLALVYILLSINTIGFTIRFGSEVLITGLTPLMPIPVYLLGFLTLAVAAALTGPAKTVRICEAWSPGIIVVLFLMIASAIPVMEVNDLRPMLDSEPVNIARAAMISGSFLSEWLLIAMVFAKYVRTDKPYIPSFFGAALATLLLASAAAAVISTFGAEEASRLIFGFLHVTRQINIGFIIRGVESLFLFPWLWVIFLKSSLHLAATVVVVNELARLRITHHIPWLLGIGVFAVSYIPDSLVDTTMFNEQIATMVTLPYVLLITVLATIANRRSNRDKTSARRPVHSRSYRRVLGTNRNR